MDNNFLPNIKCPHCRANLITSLSGFGSELNIREKECYKCNKLYFLHIYVTTSIEKTVNDGIISNWKKRISYIIQKRKENLAQLLIKHEFLSKIYNEGIDKAKQIRANNNLN